MAKGSDSSMFDLTRITMGETGGSLHWRAPELLPDMSQLGFLFEMFKGWQTTKVFGCKHIHNGML